ncbi:MAG: hypothetical protein COA43_02390 [Robiginitomaculum sp.]|nr:MAG: hypothetical protein COA43_02390 [Robiginitomaculum sp.]
MGIQQASCDLNTVHIGAMLRAAREEQGLSFPDISEQLKIPTHYLAAIESLDKDALPSLGYVLGFIRAYALHLGLDAKDAVARYKIEIECPKNLGLRNRPHYVPKNKLRLPRGSFAAGMVLSCMIVVVSWYGWKTDANSAQITTPILEQDKSWTLDSIEPIQGDEDLIALKAVGPSWVHVVDKDGIVLISRIMVPGEMFETKRDLAPVLSLRDAGAIELYFGGKRLGAVGQKGESAKDIPLADVAQ